MLISKSHPYVNTSYFVSRSPLNAVVPIVQMGKLRQTAIKGDAWGHVLGLAISRGIWIPNSYLYFLTTKPRSFPVQVQFQVQGFTKKTHEQTWLDVYAMQTAMVLKTQVTF